MTTKLVLPRPSNRYDPREESQRNQLIEQAFSRVSAPPTGGGGGAVAWGGITGTLSAQADLVAALNASSASAAWGSVTGTLSAQADLVAALNARGGLATANTWVGANVFSANTGFNQPTPLRRVHVVGTDGSGGALPAVLGPRNEIVYENNGNANIGLVCGNSATASLLFYRYSATAVSGFGVDYSSGSAVLNVQVEGTPAVAITQTTFRYNGNDVWHAGSPDIRDSRGNVRDISQTTTRNSAYTFALADRGCYVIKTNTNAYTWTIPAEATLTFPNGTVITLINDGTAGAVTVSPAAGVTLRSGATDGAFTLAAEQTRRILKIGTNRWRVL